MMRPNQFYMGQYFTTSAMIPATKPRLMVSSNLVFLARFSYLKVSIQNLLLCAQFHHASFLQAKLSLAFVVNNKMTSMHFPSRGLRIRPSDADGPADTVPFQWKTVAQPPRKRPNRFEFQQSDNKRQTLT